MPQLFRDVANAADEGQTSAVRALQAWQFLIAKAGHRQIVRYDDVREMMEYNDSRPLRFALACIMWYCEQNDLPPLTILVVNQSGTPGAGFTAERVEDYHRSREQVFDYQWYRIVPPTVAEFRQAFIRGYHAAPTDTTQPLGAASV